MRTFRPIIKSSKISDTNNVDGRENEENKEAPRCGVVWGNFPNITLAQRPINIDHSWADDHGEDNEG